MKKLAKIVCAVLAAAMTVVTVAGCGGSSSSFKAETINIGCSGPLTGGAAVYGTAVNNSAKMAIEEINAAGGLDGIKFAFEMMDDEHKAEKIDNNYASLMDQGMQISLGTVTSAPCLAWTPLAVQDNLFCLTPSATNDDVPNGTNVFQMCFADAGQGVNAATQIKGL
ncbi:MAG: ABC transporter substrate-binding protein, partial [Clostridia bacterium]|nr:ABC transporter substrate-binding protein [Clostridia bacterium]